MPTDQIVLYGEDVLRDKAAVVDPSDPDLPRLIERMVEVMREAAGLGLAANQIGVAKQVFVYDVGEGPHAVLNPRIVKKRGKQEGVEGCLSVPGLQGEVRRANFVIVEGQDVNGDKVRVEAEGITARVFQHEIDHLNGTLFVDRADPDTLHWITQEEEDST